jgi:uncharacterized protein YbjT (DUF2867 family)
MNASQPRRVAVFGGTGFLGGHVVRHLARRQIPARVISRHPDRADRIFRDQASTMEVVQADVNEDASVRAAVTGADGVVNAVSLYVERGRETFQSIHVDAAARVARHAREAGVARLVHVSGLGADARSRSSYIRSRGEGEDAVRAEFPEATIARSAVMFGPGDAFLVPLLDLLRRLPVFPLFGRGTTTLQPAYVEDVADAIARMLATASRGEVYELAGPRAYRYKALLRVLRGFSGATVMFVPVPFAIWHGLASLAERLPRPPVTHGQIELMQIDTVAGAGRPGFKDLGIEPRELEPVLASMLGKVPALE